VTVPCPEPSPDRVPAEEHAPAVPVTVYLARHGRTALNAAGVLRGRLDPPLDDEGEAEAQRLTRALAGAGIGAILSSPLRRALQTASAVAAATGLHVEVADGLADRDYGDWAGHRSDELADRFGSVDAAPGVEPEPEVRCRALAVLDAVVAQHPAAPVLLVAHDAVNQLLLRALDPTLGPPGPRQRTGCFNELERRDGRWRVLLVDMVGDSPG
jgi:broad specificity phosphatase PhoE